MHFIAWLGLTVFAMGILGALWDARYEILTLLCFFIPPLFFVWCCYTVSH